MSRFYSAKPPAAPPKKQPKLPTLAKPLFERACTHIAIFLRCGTSCLVQIDGLEEDEDGVIYGKVVDGRNIAIPADHVAYCIESNAPGD